MTAPPPSGTVVAVAELPERGVVKEASLGDLHRLDHLIDYGCHAEAMPHYAGPMSGAVLGSTIAVHGAGGCSAMSDRTPFDSIEGCSDEDA